MKDFQRHQKIGNFLSSPPVLIIMALAAVFLAYKLVGIVGRSRETADKRRESEARLAELQRQKAALGETLEDLQTGWGSEKALVDKFRVVKEGEGLVVILEPEENAESENGRSENRGLWRFLKNLFR